MGLHTSLKEDAKGLEEIRRKRGLHGEGEKEPENPGSRGRFAMLLAALIVVVPALLLAGGLMLLLLWLFTHGV